MLKHIKKINNSLIFVLLILSIKGNLIFAQSEQIRIMQYNILEYTNSGTGGSSSARDTYFRTILNTVAPDIVTADEIANQSDANYFLSDVLNKITPTNQYDIGFVTNTSDNSDNNAIYYKHSKFTFLSAQQLTNYTYGNHPIYLDQLYNNLTGDKIYIFVVHLTSNTYGSGAESQRNTEANAINSMVANMPSGSYYIASGDFNLYSGGNEHAYSTLLNKFVDPLGLPLSSWTSSDYYKYYTLGTRKDGSLHGDKGGMHYKIDFIFNSQSIVDNGGIDYIGPFVTYGNDDQHYNQSINDPPKNTAVGQTIADALYYASDHLPVYADYTFAVPSSINPPYPGSIVFTQVGVNDGSSNNYIEFMTLYRMNLTSLKITSNPVQSTGQIADGNYYDLSNTNWTDVPAGTFVRLGNNLNNDNNASDRILQYNGSGSASLPNLIAGSSNQLIAYTGSAPVPTYYIAGIHWGDTNGWSSSSNAPFDTPSSSNITLTSTSEDNWYYSNTASGNLYSVRNSLTTQGNWSSITPGGFQNLSSNISSNALPVELSSFTGRIDKDKIILQWRTETEVNNYGFEIQRSTDKISWSKIGFVPGNGNSNAPNAYTFIDKNPIGGTVYYRLKQEDNDGRFEYSKIIELNYTIPLEVSLLQNYPNPFNPVSTIKYSIPEYGFVSLKVYDVLGRLVTTLVNGKQEAGQYSVKFNGNGLASGIYFYVLTTNNFVISKKMNLLK
jgi:hypothetical protein